MNILLSCEIKRCYNDNKILKAIDLALRPDNLVPEIKGLSITQEIKENSLVFKIIAENVGVLKNTVDDLLRAVIVAEKSLKKIRGMLI